MSSRPSVRTAPDIGEEGELGIGRNDDAQLGGILRAMPEHSEHDRHPGAHRDQVALGPGGVDLKVMTRRESWASAVEIFAGPQIAADADTTLLVALDDHCGVDGIPRLRLDAALLPAGSVTELGGH